jgi:ribosomal protein S27E
MKTRDKIIKQIEIQEAIQSAGFNIVECGNCGSVVLHKINKKNNIDCPYCDEIMAKSDCPDFLYSGLENNAEFNN